MPNQEATPFVAFTIRKNTQGRFLVAGWRNRAVAMWSCESETLHLWSANVRFGEPIAETNELAGARAVLPQSVDSIVYTSPDVELYVTR